MASWTPLVILLCLLSVLVAVRRLLNKHLPGVAFLLTHNEEVAFLVYFLILFPGVVLHELSHWVFAKLLGVPTGGVSIGPKPMSDGKRIEMGAVRIGATDPFRESLIGLAPLLTGTCLVLYVASRRLGVEILSPLVISELPPRVGQYLSAQDAWVWIYLIFAVSNAMLPSSSDRRPWGSLLLYASTIALVFYFVGGMTRIPEQVVGLGLAVVRYLSWAFGLTLVVDLLVMLVLLLVEGVIWVALGSRLQ